MRFNKKVVIGVFISILIFTVIVLGYSWFDKTIPDSLIYGFFGLSSAESGFLGALKYVERKTKAKTEEIVENIISEEQDANEEV